MITDISEFSYGFALTNELIDVFGLAGYGAPKFPTQVQEGRTGGGYDVQLPGIPVFIQFKRSAVLKRSNALDAAFLGLPYYRFGIMPSSHSQQHQLLLDLESEDKFVFYAAPIFRKSHELDRFFVGKSVRQNSLFLKPSTVGKIGDSKSHTISFTNSGPIVFRSEPILMERDDISLLFEQKYISDEKVAGNISRRKLIEELVDIYSNRLGFLDSDLRQSLRAPSEERDPIQHLAYLARNLFNCELVYM